MLGSQLVRLLHEYRTVTHTVAGWNDLPEDFPSYYVAAETARNPADHRLYYLPEKPFLLILGDVPKDTPWARTAQAHGFKSSLPFNCPPFAAWFLEPLSLFPWQVSLLLWRITIIGLVLLSIYFALLLTETESLLLPFVLIAAAAFSFFPFTESVFQGQIDAIVLFTWVAGAYLQKTNRPVWSALLFALGTMVKVSPIIVVGVFLLRRQWKWLVSYAAWVGILVGFSIWRLGWENHVLWAVHVLPVLSHGAPYFANKSIAALIYETYLGRVPLDPDFQIPAFLFRVVSILNFCIYGGTLFYFWRKNRRDTAITYELIVMALLALLISPLTWRHYYLLALLPLVFLWIRVRGNALVLAAATLAIGMVFPDYLIVLVRNPVVDILMSTLVPLATLSLLFMLLVGYAAPERSTLSGDGWRIMDGAGPVALRSIQR